MTNSRQKGADGRFLPIGNTFKSRPGDNDVVDHIDRNKNNNTMANLRNVDKSMNAFNSKTRVNNTSGVSGVWYRKDTHKWCAEIKVNYKKISLGCFDLLEDATRVRKETEVVYYGR